MQNILAFEYDREFELDCVEFRRRCRTSNVAAAVDMIHKYRDNGIMHSRLLDSKTLWVVTS